MENLLQQLTELTDAIAGFLWGNLVTLGLLLGMGLYLTIRTGFIQVRGVTHAMAITRGKHTRPDEAGEVSHFQALSTALSATIGTGNIAGVATAISLGGPGALFWMWVTAVFGMATKFVECTLAVRYREIDDSGEVSGGPMYTLLHGLNFPRLAALFAFFALIAALGIGNMVQANSVVDGLRFIWPDLGEYGWMVGVVLGILVGMVILGGIRRIARAAATLVPFMATVYIGGALIVLAAHIPQIPAAFATILEHALNPWSVGGAAVGEAIRWGVARGMFSNEAGLGSSPIAHAAARTNEPVREGLVAMLEPFIDTLIVCTLTGLVIIVTGAYLSSGEDMVGASLTAFAFSQTLGDAGGWMVGIALTLFAFSTMIAWSYYGDRSARFLFGEGAVMPYRVVFTLLVVVGAAVPLQLVWNLADITNLLMALPNLLSLALLGGVVVTLQRDYFTRQGILNK